MEKLEETGSGKIALLGILSEVLENLDAGKLTAKALESHPPPSAPPVIIAVGKAATSMATAAIEWLGHSGLCPGDGLVVCAHQGNSPHSSLELIVGDHPVPGKHSLAASDALALLVQRLAPDTPVEVFLSGGTTSLIAAPIGGGSQAELAALFRSLHRNGLPIREMNRTRSASIRWGGGRLAEALGPRSGRVWCISDVVGNDLAAIGSGPMVLEGNSPAVPHLLVADRHTIMDELTLSAASNGFPAVAHSEPLDGDATDAVKRVLGKTGSSTSRPRGLRSGQLWLEGWSGETTVRLPEGHGRGGRCQQMALSAARLLADIPTQQPGPLAILAVGTDGRDGPTDAAGALVDRDSWSEIKALGFAPEEALRRCDSFPVLDAIGALLRPGPTGNNLGDLLLVLHRT